MQVYNIPSKLAVSKIPLDGGRGLCSALSITQIQIYLNKDEH